MSVSSTQELPNRVDSGASNLVRGSSTSSDTNDPVFLDHDGEHYVYFSGVVGNYANATVSWAASTSFVFYLDVALHTLLPASTERVVSDAGVVVSISTTGNLIVQYRETGSTYNNFGQASPISLTALGFATAGDRRQLKLEIDTDTGTLTAYARASGSDLLTDTSWGTAVGSIVQAGFIGDDRKVESSSTLNLGGGSASFNTVCELYRFAIVDNDGATTDVDVNPSVDIDTTSDPDAGQSSFTATSGQTVTVNRSASGLATAVVTRPVMLFDGTDDYLQLPTSDTPSFTKAAGEFTAVAVLRNSVSNASATHTTQRLLSWESAADDGCLMSITSSNGIAARVGDGTSVVANGGTLTTGRLTVVAIVVDDGNLYCYRDGGGLTSATALSGVTTEPEFTSSGGRIGVRDSVTNSLAAEVFAVLVFDGTALTESELDALATRFREGSYS